MPGAAVVVQAAGQPLRPSTSTVQRRQEPKASRVSVAQSFGMRIPARPAARSSEVPAGTVKSRLHRALGRLRQVVFHEFPALRPEVVDAVADGRFRVWAVRTFSDALEIVSGLPLGEPDEQGRYPAGSVGDRCMVRLDELNAAYLRANRLHPPAVRPLPAARPRKARS